MVEPGCKPCRSVVQGPVLITNAVHREEDGNKMGVTTAQGTLCGDPGPKAGHPGTSLPVL